LLPAFGRQSDWLFPLSLADFNAIALKAHPDAKSGSAPYMVSLRSYNNYPFGMLQPERHWSSEEYRYGYNGKEMENDL